MYVRTWFPPTQIADAAPLAAHARTSTVCGFGDRDGGTLPPTNHSPALDEEYLACPFAKAIRCHCPGNPTVRSGTVKRNRSEYVAVAQWHYGNRTESAQKPTRKTRRTPPQPVLSARVKLNIIRALSRFAGRADSGVGPPDAA